MSELTPRHLHDYYLNDYAHKINERDHNHGGGWLDGPPDVDPDDPDDVARYGPEGPRQVPHYYMDVSRNEDDPHSMVGEAFRHTQRGIYDLNADVYAKSPPGWAIPHRLTENAEEGLGTWTPTPPPPGSTPSSPTSPGQETDDDRRRADRTQ